MKRIPLCGALLWACAAGVAGGARPEAEGAGISIDARAVPQMLGWAEKARELLRRWHPRVRNLLAGPGMAPEQPITLEIKKSAEGVAWSSGTRIVICSGWLEKHPGDFGVVIHELAHVVQKYRTPEPSWITEGIADYIRWVVYEGKSQSFFPVPPGDAGYRKGYQASAGFLFWLETHDAPGIVRRLNTAMRQGRYDPDIFKRMTGRDLPALWRRYAVAASASVGQPGKAMPPGGKTTPSAPPL